MSMWLTPDRLYDAFVAAIFLFAFWFGFVMKAYGLKSRRVATVCQCLLIAVLLSLNGYSAYLWFKVAAERYLVGVGAVTATAAFVLYWKQSLANPIVRVDEPAIVTHATEKVVGRCCLAVEEDRVLARDNAPFPLLATVGMGVAVLLSVFVPNFAGSPLLVTLAGRAFGARVKCHRWQPLLEARAGKLLIGGVACGPLQQAVLRVVASGGDHVVQLAGNDNVTSTVVLKMNTHSDADTVATILRGFLEKREWETIWPPAPDEAGAVT